VVLCIAAIVVRPAIRRHDFERSRYRTFAAADTETTDADKVSFHCARTNARFPIFK